MVCVWIYWILDMVDWMSVVKRMLHENRADCQISKVYYLVFIKHKSQISVSFSINKYFVGCCCRSSKWHSHIHNPHPTCCFRIEIGKRFWGEKESESRMGGITCHWFVGIAKLLSFIFLACFCVHITHSNIKENWLFHIITLLFLTLIHLFLLLFVTLLVLGIFTYSSLSLSLSLYSITE